MNSSRGTLVNNCQEGINFNEILRKYNKLQFSVAKIIEFTHRGVLHPYTKIANGTLLKKLLEMSLRCHSSQKPSAHSLIYLRMSMME